MWSCITVLRVTSEQKKSCRFCPQLSFIILPENLRSFINPRHIVSSDIMHYAFYITHYAFRIPHSALCIPHCAFRITHSALHITHYALRISHSAFCILHSTLCIKKGHTYPVKDKYAQTVGFTSFRFMWCSTYPSVPKRDYH